MVDVILLSEILDVGASDEESAAEAVVFDLAVFRLDILPI